MQYTVQTADSALQSQKRQIQCFIWRARPCNNAVWSTVKPRYSAPAYNEFPPIEHMNFGPKKCFYSHLYIGNSENLNIEYNFGQSLEIRYIGV